MTGSRGWPEREVDKADPHFTAVPCLPPCLGDPSASKEGVEGLGQPEDREKASTDKVSR